MISLFWMAWKAALLFLWGGIAPGFLWMKYRGVDIRSQGSGNIGATNVMRSGGKWIGISVFFLDALKAFLPVILSSWMQMDPLWIGVCVILGHVFSPWLGFKGGKGISAFFGLMLAMGWPFFLICGLTWLLILFATRYVFLASLGAVWMHIPLFVCGFSDYLIQSVCLSLLLTWAHRKNIYRWYTGEEPKTKKF